MHEGMPTLAIHPSILTFFYEIEILYHKFMYLLVLNKCTYFIREVIVLHQVLEKINIKHSCMFAKHVQYYSSNNIWSPIN